MDARVLVIDDNAELLELYESVLGWNGYRAICLQEPPGTLTVLDESRPDAVILDLHFGGQQFDGWRFLQLLRSDRARDQLPVVVCTAGLAEVRDAEDWLRRHNVWVLTKPFMVNDLERVLREALAKSPTKQAAAD